MGTKPELHAMLAREDADGWVVVLPGEVPLEAAEAMCADDDCLHMLVDPHDEIALAAWERWSMPWNRPRLKGCSGD